MVKSFKNVTTSHASLFEILNDTLGDKKRVNAPFTAAVSYWRMLPSLLTKEAQHLHTYTQSVPQITEKQFTSVIKQSWLRPEAFISLFQEPPFDFSKDLGRIFLFTVLPRLILISSFKKSENNTHAFIQSLKHMIRMVADKKLLLTVSLCPPYTYTLLKNGLLTSRNGAFRTYVGKGFGKTVRLLKEVFSPLAALDVAINIQYLTYSGETNHEDLLEITLPTRDYYLGKENEMLSSLQLTFNDAHNTVKEVLQDSGIAYEMISIEKKYSKKVDKLAKVFLGKAATSKENAIKWLSTQLGVKVTWLNTFIESEEKEAIIMGALEDEVGLNTSRIGRNGLQRGLLYYCILQSLYRQKRFLIDLESQCYTMQDSIPQYTTFIPPVITGKAFNEPFGIRGPFEYEKEEENN